MSQPASSSLQQHRDALRLQVTAFATPLKVRLLFLLLSRHQELKTPEKKRQIEQVIFGLFVSINIAAIIETRGHILQDLEAMRRKLEALGTALSTAPP